MQQSSSDKSQRAYDLGYEYEKAWGDCSQATIRALMEVFGEKDPALFKGMAGFHGGGGCECDGSCGAYCASIFYLGMRKGRQLTDLGRDPQDPKALKGLGRLNQLIKAVHERFIAEYGSVVCSQICRNLYGRSFYFNDPDDGPKFEAKGGHDWGCTGVVGNGARWTVEVLEADEKNGS